MVSRLFLFFYCFLSYKRTKVKHIWGAFAQISPQPVFCERNEIAMSNMISAEQRELLYKEIWDEAMSKVAKRYSISDVALRKKCLLWGIPIPSREYRGRVAHGQKPYRTPLPELTREMKRYVYGYAITFKNIGSLPDAALTVRNRCMYIRKKRKIYWILSGQEQFPSLKQSLILFRR